MLNLEKFSGKFSPHKGVVPLLYVQDARDKWNY